MKELPPMMEFPNEDDVQKAVDFVCHDVPPGQVFTEAQRSEIQRVSRQIMMRRMIVH